MDTTLPPAQSTSTLPTVDVSPIDRLLEKISRHWLLFVSLLVGIYVGLPFLAPVFMHIGWQGLGRAIYTIYSFLCHQLPERSYFLFGKQISYSIPEIQSAWQNTDDFMVLRKFIGNPEMGWKMAWSDRMVAMYTLILPFGFLWSILQKKLKKLPWWGLILFLLPMAVDGTTHMISDFAGIGQGFRDTNSWLAVLTNQAFRPEFYAGDALGSFNSIARILSGVFFAAGVVWFLYPYLDEAFRDIADSISYKRWQLKKAYTKARNHTGSQEFNR